MRKLLLAFVGIAITGSALAQSGKNTSLSSLPVVRAQNQSSDPSEYFCEAEASTTRVLGGGDTTPEEWPGFLSLINKDGYLECGAVLIDREWALTAAHCVVDDELGFSIPYERYVSADLMDLDPISVQQVIVHPEYIEGIRWGKGFADAYVGGTTFGFDIALLKMDSKNYQTVPADIAIPSDDEALPPGTCVTAVGWGNTIELDEESTDREVDEATPTVLQYVELPLQESSKCGSMGTGHLGNLTDIICAGYEQGGRDTCQGDSGGPVYGNLGETEALTLIGLTSWGDGCGRAELPGIYTRVSAYLPWIDETIEAINAAEIAYAQGEEFYEEGDLKEAAAALGTAYQLYKATAGPEAYWTNTSSYWLGIVHYELEQYGSAARLLKATYDYEVKLYDSEDPYIAETMRWLAASYSAIGLYEEALELFEQVLISDEIHNRDRIEDTEEWIEWVKEEM